MSYRLSAIGYRLSALGPFPGSIVTGPGPGQPVSLH
jgi:hypothetical protein